MTIKHTPGKWSSQWAEKNMNYIPGPIAQLYPTKVNEELLVLAWASWQTRLESLEEDYVEAEANALLMALAPTAPHECDDPECPGNKNRLKLEAYRDLLEAVKAQHHAIDFLFAMLIERDRAFYPSKSGLPWEAMVQGNAALAKVEGEEEAK